MLSHLQQRSNENLNLFFPIYNHLIYKTFASSLVSSSILMKHWHIIAENVFS